MQPIWKNARNLRKNATDANRSFGGICATGNSPA